MAEQLEKARGTPWKIFPYERKDEEDFLELSKENHNMLFELRDEFHRVMVKNNLTYLSLLAHFSGRTVTIPLTHGMTN